MKTSTKLALYSTFFFVLFSCPALAQNKAIIRGRVTDILSKESLPFVNIKLTQAADSSISTDIQSDAEGFFAFKNLGFHRYNLRFTYMGYQAKTLKNIGLSTESPEVNLQDIDLSGDSKMLEEVIVEYKRPVVEMLDDKLVYNVDQGVFSEGSSAIDILKNVPMVSVDIDGKATIAGRRNTRVFIDGKPTDFSSASIGELLSVLPSDALESIEVITDPSSKFDADGDGIINLVMKKGKKVGLSGNVSTTGGTMGNYRVGSFLSSRKKDSFAFNASAGYNHDLRQSDASSARSNFLTDTVFYNNQSNNSESLSNGMNGRFSGDYKPDSSQTLKFSARGGYNKSSTSSISNNLYLDDEFVEKRIRRQNNNTGNDNFNYVLDADYSLKGKKKTNYDFAINLNRNAREDHRNYSRFILNPDGSLRDTEPDMQLNNNDDAGTNLQLSADIDKSYDFLKLRVETGAKFDLSNSDNSQLVRKLDHNSQEYQIDEGLSNSFNYRQNIYAGYLSLRMNIKKWSIRAGTRAELTSVSLDQDRAEKYEFEPYLNLFPSVGLIRSFKGKYRVGLTYSRRVTRPRYNVLNPLVDDSDPQNIKFGNIDLKPSTTDQYEFSFTMFGKGWSVSPRVSYAASHKIIERIKTVVNSNGDTETTFKNLANSNSLNFNTFANYQVDKSKSLNAGITVSHVDYNSSANNTFNRNGIAVRANLGTSYSFSKNTAAELNLNYIKNRAAQGSSNGSVQSQFGLKRNFMKNKMSARLTVVDPFSDRNISSITEGPNFYQESFSTQQTRNIMAGLSYRFTKITGK